MAVTVLMHMKESPGCAYTHLKNGIDYILDVKHDGEKTKHGLLVGGNSGTDHNEILQNFLDTKNFYGKPEGRQGYHYVVSFAKGETNENIAYEVLREFCEEYLGDKYDYVFAIHVDKGHMHGHIVFNSVSRADGYKYHYKKGDWKKYIQPVTDRVCVEHNLQPLVFEEERVGVSYAEWIAEREGKYNWSHIIRADIDYAIQQSDSFEEFENVMQKMSYQIRKGYSKKHNAEYFTFKFISPDGKEHRRRSYNLPAGYSPEEIMQRLQIKSGSKSYEEIMQSLSEKSVDYSISGMQKSMRTFTRLYQAVSYYKLPNPYAVPAHRVRKDMLRIDRLLDECRYLKENNIQGRDSLERKMDQLVTELEEFISERRKLYGILDQVEPELLALMERYSLLQKEMQSAEREGSSRWEAIEDEMLDLEKQFPHELLEIKDRVDYCNKEIGKIRKEKRLVKRILETEGKEKSGPVQDLKIKT